MAVSLDEVIWGYRLILGREPENPRVVEEHARLPSLQSLRRRCWTRRSSGRAKVCHVSLTSG
jgi:hypothetical protein